MFIDDVRHNTVGMYGKMPKAMLIIENGIYTIPKFSGFAQYRMGLSDTIFDPNRFDDVIERHPYPNKQIVQLSKRVGHRVFKLGYPVARGDVSELFGKQYLIFDVWAGKKENYLNTNIWFDENTYHFVVPLNINLAEDKTVAAIKLSFYMFEDVVGFILTTLDDADEYGYLSGTRWYSDTRLLGYDDTMDKVLDVQKDKSGFVPRTLIYEPIKLNGFQL